MSLIRLKCVDQTLQFYNTPKLYSGDVNFDYLQVDFDSSWKNYNRTAIFYNEKDHVYYQELDFDNKCVIPKEVIAKEGYFYLGVFGSYNDSIVTSEIKKYKIYEGAITEGLETPEPNLDIWEQILADYGNVKADLMGTVERIEDIEDTLNTHTHDNRYYTESEINTKLNGKSNTGHTHTKSEITDFSHNHDDRYYTESEINSALSTKANLITTSSVTVVCKGVRSYTGVFVEAKGSATLSKSGYTALGIVGAVIDEVDTNDVLKGFEVKSGKAVVTIMLQPVAGPLPEQSIDVNCTILWLKNS